MSKDIKDDGIPSGVFPIKCPAQGLQNPLLSILTLHVKAQFPSSFKLSLHGLYFDFHGLFRGEDDAAYLTSPAEITSLDFRGSRLLLPAAVINSFIAEWTSHFYNPHLTSSSRT